MVPNTKLSRSGQVLVDQPSRKPTNKVVAGGTATGVSSVLIGLADEVGIDLSWLTDKPILFGLVVAAIGAAVAYLKREELVS